MGTITSLMDIARQALMADQEALNVTSNNVANQNTAGYTREVVNFQSVDAVTLSGGTFGSGVTASAASQRDRVLEQQVQQQTQTQAQSGRSRSALQQIQNIFGLSSTTEFRQFDGSGYGDEFVLQCTFGACEQSLRYGDAAECADCSQRLGGRLQFGGQPVDAGVFGT